MYYQEVCLNLNLDQKYDQPFTELPMNLKSIKLGSSYPHDLFDSNKGTLSIVPGLDKLEFFAPFYRTVLGSPHCINKIKESISQTISILIFGDDSFCLPLTEFIDRLKKLIELHLPYNYSFPLIRDNGMKILPLSLKKLCFIKDNINFCDIDSKTHDRIIGLDFGQNESKDVRRFISNDKYFIWTSD